MVFMLDSDSNQSPLTYLYLDDSGSRNPDHGAKPIPNPPPFDYFAMGGFMVDAEHHEAIADSVLDFASRWGFELPLHSVRIRRRRDNFKWLGTASGAEVERFMAELSCLVTTAPITVLGCVVDRPGYNARYKHIYEGRRWQMCKTAFTITVERATRVALARGRRLRVICEETGRAEDRAIRSYFRALRESGMPFDVGRSAVYGPLTARNFGQALASLDFKSKTSEHIQVADLVVYPLARAGYQADYRPFIAMREARVLIDCHLQPHEVALKGIKYSCFSVPATL